MAKRTASKNSPKYQIGRFILSAGAGFLVDVLTFSLFLHFVFIDKTYPIFTYHISNYTLSLAVSFFLGVLVNFLMTRYIVFTESESSFSKQFFRFFSVAIFGFFANLLVLKFFIVVLNFYPPFARVLAALSLFFASFFVHKVFSFSLSLKRNGHRPNSQPGS